VVVSGVTVDNCTWPENQSDNNVALPGIDVPAAGDANSLGANTDGFDVSTSDVTIKNCGV
jgi:hypothetical protein